ncbi:MAG: ABC transporter ATP-binding protein, partial [Desulfomonilia bacterium]|nr:ABC transporter ATP-binding protein [Desulfomonilia bacterium]
PSARRLDHPAGSHHLQTHRGFIAMESSFITVKDLSFGYEKDKLVFKNLTFSLKKGRLYALMGGNGSGKTTILRCLSGLLPGYTGTISLNGSSITTLTRKQSALLMSIVPQEHSTIFPYLVRNMVLMGRAPHVGMLSLPGKKDRELANQAMEEVGIRDLADKLYTKISGGERQLVLIARALAQNTPVMILDEPTSHLDYRNQMLILSIIRLLVQERGLLAFTAIHDPNHALHFADEVLLLHNGHIIKQGIPDTVITRDSMREVYGIEVDEVISNGRTRGIIPAENSLLLRKGSLS